MALSPVMLVEDDDDLRDSLAEILREEGHGVIAAQNGKHALDLLALGEPPSVIVLDLMMPVMDGWQFLRRLREDPRFAKIPVVVVSAAGERHVEGAAYAIAKPLALEKLLSLLQLVGAHANESN